MVSYKFSLFATLEHCVIGLGVGTCDALACELLVVVHMPRREGATLHEKHFHTQQHKGCGKQDDGYNHGRHWRRYY